MIEFTLREVSPAEYRNSLRREIEENGLYKAIEKRCDEINGECRDMGYVQHRTIQELLSEILELIELR